MAADERDRCRSLRSSGVRACQVEASRARAAGGGYIIVRDATCRLFGYHGLVGSDRAFSFDHMFGF